MDIRHLIRVTAGITTVYLAGCTANSGGLGAAGVEAPAGVGAAAGTGASAAVGGAPAVSGTSGTPAVSGTAGIQAITGSSGMNALAGNASSSASAGKSGMSAGAGTGAGAGTASAGTGAVAEAYLGVSALDPAEGFQVRNLGVEVPPGQDVEYCEVAQMPGSPSDVYWIDEVELGNARGSHHLIVSAAVPGGPAEQKIKQLKIGERVPCLNARLPFGETGIVDVAGIQQPYDRFTMPEGVGWKYYGAQYLVFDYHFLNTTSQSIQARSVVNFHTTTAAAIKHEATGFSVLNYTIDTPAHSSKSFTAECHVKKDVMVSSLARHTHKFGTDFEVWFSGGARDGEHIWTSTDWEVQTQYKFPTPFMMKAGEGFRFRCGFENPGDKPLRFGTSATDEMCILFVGIWEAHDGEGTGETSCSIVWTDAQGVGHAADEAGGIPKAPALTSATCGIFSGTDTECKSCTCESCGAPSVACALDPDCLAILTCFSDCVASGKKGEDCTVPCQDTLDMHSSGVGLSRQASACIHTMCKTCEGF